MTQSFRLSVAELAFAMVYSGALEAGYGYLQTMLEDIQPERFNDWMTSASHALIARGLLKARPDGSYGELDSDLGLIAQCMVRDQRTLRCHRSQGGPDGAIEQFVSVLFDETLIVAHWIEQNIVAVVEEIPSRSDAVADIALFIGVPGDLRAPVAPLTPQTIPTDYLTQLRRAASSLTAAQMEEHLKQFIIDADFLPSLARTLTANDAVWGDVLRIERINDEVTAQRGFLFVSDAETAWLLHSAAPDGSLLEVLPGTPAAVASLCDEALD